MVKSTNVMYQIKENELIIYSVTADFESINQCYEECCSHHMTLTKKAKQLTDLDINEIFDKNLCCELYKKQTGFIDPRKKEVPLYDVEYREVMKPYPIELQILSELKTGHFNYLKQWVSIVNKEIKDKLYLKDINDKLLDSIEITVMETIPFESMLEVLTGLVTSNNVNRELQYSSGVLAKYYLPDQIVQEVKK